MNARHFTLALAFIGVLPLSAWPQPLVSYRVDGLEIRASLSGKPGDAKRGREVVVNREQGACLLCHGLPESGERFMGNLAPPLSGVGARLTAAQLRLRLVDSTRLNPATIMPSYYRIDGLNQVGAAWKDKPVLSAQQIEDAIAYLQQLK